MGKSKNEIVEALEHCIASRPNSRGLTCNSCPYFCDRDQTLTCGNLLRDAREYIIDSGVQKQETVFGIPEKFIRSTMDPNDREIDLSIVHEEMGELIQALSKYKRAVKACDDAEAKRARNQIVEETVHVAVSCGKLAKLFDITQEEIDAEVKRKSKAMAIERGCLRASATYHMYWDLPIGANAIGSKCVVIIKEVGRLNPVLKMKDAVIESVEMNCGCVGDSKTQVVIQHEGKTYCFETIGPDRSNFRLISIEASL